MTTRVIIKVGDLLANGLVFGSAAMWIDPTFGPVADYLTEGDAPLTSLYACAYDGSAYAVAIPAPPGFVARHGWGGWPETDWVAPPPVELSAELPNLVLS